MADKSRIVCEICGRETEPSKDFVDYCERCVNLYGDLIDIGGTKFSKEKRQRKRIDN
jgi:hypothetical protein